MSRTKRPLTKANCRSRELREKAGAPAKCPKDQTKARRIYGAAVVVGQGDSWDAGGDGGGFGGDDEFGGSEVGGMDEFGGMGGHSHGPGGHMH